MEGVERLSGQPHFTPERQKPEGAAFETFPAPKPEPSLGLWNVWFSWGCLWAKCTSEPSAASQIPGILGDGVREPLHSIPSNPHCCNDKPFISDSLLPRDAPQPS